MILFVVPAYDKEQNIGRLIEEIHRFTRSKNYSYRLFVVDDGSRDRTAQVVLTESKLYPVTLISYRPNRGVQEAFRRGFHAALSEAKETDLIVTLEADGTADREILPVFMEKIAQGFDVVVASYYAKGGSVEGTVCHRKLLSLAGNFFIRHFLRIKGVRTYSSFYRIYKPAALRKVLELHGDFFEEKGFACVVELLLRLDRAGFRIGEVPMILKGSARIGKSKMKVFQTVLGYLRIAFRHAV